MYKIKDIQNLRVITEQWGEERLSLISFLNVQLRKLIFFQNKWMDTRKMLLLIELLENDVY